MALKRTSTRETTMPLEADFLQPITTNITTAFQSHFVDTISGLWVYYMTGNDTDGERFMLPQDMEYSDSFLLFIL
jgi:hypothetical protein